MKRIIYILSVMTLFAGCTYNELPPKTDDITTYYLLPTGEEPSDEEKDFVAAAIEEYESSVKKITH